MIKKLIKAVTKRDKQVNDICSQFDKLQEEALKNIQ